MRKPFISSAIPAVVAVLMASTAALAQNAPDPGSKPSTLEQDYHARDQAIMDGGQTAMSTQTVDLSGMTVYDSAGEAIGEVERVETLPNGDIDSLIVSQGGILGDGAKKVSVDGDNITVEGDRVMLDLTGSQVSELPDYGDPTEGSTVQVPAMEGETMPETVADPGRPAD